MFPFAILSINNIKTLFLGDPAYPKTLTFCPDAPLVLFYKGNLNFGQRKLVSIVGTRSGDLHGEKICRELVAGLREFDPIIVSGFARGIDIIAHDHDEGDFPLRREKQRAPDCIGGQNWR